MQLEGKVATITGGTAGIGLGIAVAFVREGASVVLSGRNPEKGEKALADIGAGSRGLFVAGDVKKQSDVEQALRCGTWSSSKAVGSSTSLPWKASTVRRF
jgi:NAD(P)-dependent dehydrogenase (short-subunit alcohol dehydrogenase family)